MLCSYIQTLRTHAVYTGIPLGSGGRGPREGLAYVIAVAPPEAEAAAGGGGGDDAFVKESLHP